MLGRRVRLKVLIGFLQSFSNMTSAGIGAARALRAIGEQSRDARLGRALSRARADIEGGTTLTEALGATGAFPPFVVGMIDVAEDAGAMDEIVKDLAGYYEWKLSMRRTVIRLAAYPVLMVPVALVLIGVFLRILDSVFGSSDFRGYVSGVSAVLAAVGIVVFMHLLARGGLRRVVLAAPVIGSIGRSIPVFGTLQAKWTLGNFAYALYLCVRAGVPIIAALKRAGSASGSATVELAAAKEVIVRVKGVDSK